MTVDEIIGAINELNVLELVELKDKLQEQWGVSAAAPVAVAAVPAAGGEKKAKEEEPEGKTEEEAAQGLSALFG